MYQVEHWKGHALNKNIFLTGDKKIKLLIKKIELWIFHILKIMLAYF